MYEFYAKWTFAGIFSGIPTAVLLIIWNTIFCKKPK